MGIFYFGNYFFSFILHNTLYFMPRTLRRGGKIRVPNLYVTLLLLRYDVIASRESVCENCLYRTNIWPCTETSRFLYITNKFDKKLQMSIWPYYFNYSIWTSNYKVKSYFIKLFIIELISANCWTHTTK